MTRDQPQHQPTPPPLQPRGFFTGVRIRPIIAGVVVDYIATSVLVLGYLIFYFFKESPEDGGLPEEALEKAFKELVSSPEGLLTIIAIGTFCTGLGGYVAGRLAGAEETKHGALVGAASLILGALQAAMIGGENAVPQGYELLGYALAIPAGALGGYLARREPAAPSLPLRAGYP